jgi:hypothetical protein
MSEPDGIVADPHAKLETAIIDEFLREHGTDRAKLKDLPPDQATRLSREASAYATARLTEVETRAHYVHEIHDATRPVGTKRPV